MKKYHETADGKFIELDKLTDEHLANIIALIERKAREGVTITNGSGHGDFLEIWADEIEGEEVLDHFDYKKYTKERKRRRKLAHK